MSSIASTVQALNLASVNGVDPFKSAQAPDASQWWGNNATAPTATQLPSWQNYSFQNYQGQTPTYQTYGAAAPTYKGLNNGDYTRLENNLRTPGELAAKTTYDNARRTLNDAATARGMYGSSNYTKQMTDQAVSPYMNTLATNSANAASQRYQLQQNDTQFGQSQAMQAWQAKLAENNNAQSMGYNTWAQLLGQSNLANQLGFAQNANMNNYNLTQAQAQDSINNRSTTFANNLAQDKYNDAWKRTQWGSQDTQRVWQNLMGLADSTDQYKDSSSALSVSRAAKANESDSGIGGLLGGIGSVAGLALAPFTGGMSSAIGSGLSGLFGSKGQDFSTGFSKSGTWQG